MVLNIGFARFKISRDGLLNDCSANLRVVKTLAEGDFTFGVTVGDHLGIITPKQ